MPPPLETIGATCCYMQDKRTNQNTGLEEVQDYSFQLGLYATSFPGPQVREKVLETRLVSTVYLEPQFRFYQ